MGQALYPNSTRKTRNLALVTTARSIWILHLHTSPQGGCISRVSAAGPQLTAASRLSRMDDGNTSCISTEYGTDIEDEQGTGDYTDSNTDIPVFNQENTGKDDVDSQVQSILTKNRQHGLDSAYYYICREEPTALSSADTSQAGNLDRSSSASGQKGKPTSTSQTTAGREKRCHDEVEGVNGIDGHRPAKRSWREDAAAKTLRSNRQPLLRTSTYSTEKSAPICHVCGFSPERLLQLTDSVEMLLASRTSLSDGETSRVMLQLLIGSVRDFVDLSHQERTIIQSSDSLKLEHAYTMDATVQLGEEMEVSSDDESTEGTDDSNSQSDGAASDGTSSSILDEGQRYKRRRWSELEEAGLRAWVREGKDWNWIADKLQRSEAAVSQHWIIMAQKHGGGKKTT
ncbi:hypothetical protein PG995_005137 [Apiospora arundinis]